MNLKLYSALPHRAFLGEIRSFLGWTMKEQLLCRHGWHDGGVFHGSYGWTVFPELLRV